MSPTIEELEELVEKQTMKRHEVANNPNLAAATRSSQLAELEESIRDYLEQLGKLKNSNH